MCTVQYHDLEGRKEHPQAPRNPSRVTRFLLLGTLVSADAETSILPLAIPSPLLCVIMRFRESRYLVINVRTLR